MVRGFVVGVVVIVLGCGGAPARPPDPISHTATGEAAAAGEFRVRVPATAALVTGAPVLVAGIRAGEITWISGGVVTFTVVPEIEVWSSARASVTSYLGAYRLELDPGESVSSAGAHHRLPAGSEIKVRDPQEELRLRGLSP